MGTLKPDYFVQFPVGRKLRCAEVLCFGGTRRNAGFSENLFCPMMHKVSNRRIGDSNPWTLAATTMPLRLPSLGRHLPIIVSGSPPLCPGTQREYTSAVSMKFKPASCAASRRRNPSASARVHPKAFPPRQIRWQDASPFSATRLSTGAAEK